VEIGAGCTIDRGVSGDTIIGAGSKLDNAVHIGHGVVVGRNCLLAAQVGIAGKTILEDEVILWGQVGVNKSLTIGKGAVVYAQSGVPASIEGGKVYFGSPVGEAREKMRELGFLKRLPEMWRRLNSK
jgi:UDP-3-O-[3-hydroxymyristoyl] glucosamine N-acyltransferase